MTPANAKLRLGLQVLKVNTFYKVQACWRMRTRKLGSQSVLELLLEPYRLPDRSSQSVQQSGTCSQSRYEL